MTPEQEDFEERAGIMEHDGGMTREEAELAAAKLIRERWEAQASE